MREVFAIGGSSLVASSQTGIERPTCADNIRQMRPHSPDTFFAVIQMAIEITEWLILLNTFGFRSSEIAIEIYIILKYQYIYIKITIVIEINIDIGKATTIEIDVDGVIDINMQMGVNNNNDIYKTLLLLK